ncbi:hypothetical protein CDAR_97401 [Caerostris darwini]|uniref:Uncharacterized protein n=1 Tax=Caerostris darwini TaxID=1538125 RepID=A0AAV4PS19_9ARAC|nr:hypothetical protein CDAR_97401 [Caerostris darwini]
MDGLLETSRKMDDRWRPAPPPLPPPIAHQCHSILKPNERALSRIPVMYTMNSPLASDDDMSAFLNMFEKTRKTSKRQSDS